MIFLQLNRTYVLFVPAPKPPRQRFLQIQKRSEAFGRLMAVDYQIPVFVQGIDGKPTVHPDDYIFGDNDGVVIIPKDHTLEILKIAEEWYEAEGKSRQAMADGKDPFDVYSEFGRF